MTMRKALDRRSFIGASAAAAGLAALAACGGGAVPTAQPAQKPAAAEPTKPAAAPAATTAPAAGAATAPAAAAKPTEAAKPAAAAPAPGKLSGKIVFLTQSGKLSEDRYNPLFTKFKEKNAGIEVEPIWAGASAAEIQQKLLTVIAGGAPLDLYWTHSYINSGLAKRKVSRDLLDLTKRDNFKLDDFFPAAIKDFELSGQQHALPRETTSTVVCFNKSLFDQAGIKPPTADWTWDDFTEIATKLTKGEGPNKVWGAAGFQQAGFSWFTLIRAWQEGGDIVNPERTKYTLNEPPGVKAVQWIADLQHKAKAHAVGMEATPQGADIAFAGGKIGMILNISVYSAFMKSPFEWDIQHLPKGTGGKQVTRNASAGHSIAAASKSSDLAWEFAKFVASPESFDHLVATGLQIPTLKSAADKLLTSYGNNPPKSVKIGVDALGYARPEPVAGDWIAVHRELTTAMEGILGPSQKPVKESLDAIAGRVNEAISSEPKG
jgi:multiple sugar transport system substrate-binding protein